MVLARDGGGIVRIETNPGGADAAACETWGINVSSDASRESLVADAGWLGYAKGSDTPTASRHRRAPATAPPQAGRSRLSSVSEPIRGLPSDILGREIEVQLPAGTNFQALPW